MTATPYLDKILVLGGPPPEEPGTDLEDDGQDWDEADWDDVQSHLEQASPWFGKVMRGESPGDPDDDGTALSRILALTPHTAEASTVPKPTRPPGGPGLFHIKGRQLPPYVQHLWHHLRKKYGDHRAYGMAIGIVKKWAAGVNPGGKGKGHKVHSDVQAAAAKNVAQWEKDKADAHTHGHSSDHHSGDKAAATSVELAIVHAYEREDLQGRLERVNSYIKDDRIRPGIIDKNSSTVSHSELASLYRANPEHSAQFREHMKNVREHFAAGRYPQAQEALNNANEIARQHAYSFVQHALAKQRDFIAAKQAAEEQARREAAQPAPQAKRGFLSKFGHRGPVPVAASRSCLPFGLTEAALAAPASWPSGKPYASSFLPPGPTTSLLQGQPTRTGVVVNGPGSAPGRLRQAPSQAVAASPPLPPGVTLPTAGEIEALAAQVPDVDDISLSNSVRTHLHTAAGKIRADDRQGALAALRSAQTGIHAAYRAAVRENMPVTAQVYGTITAVPPAAQSSATTAMLAGRQLTDKFRALNHQVAVQIDRFRRDFFHGLINQTPNARLTSPAEGTAVELAGVKGYQRENRFGRIVTVHNYIREGKPYSGKLMGDDADDAIKAGVAKGEYGEPTGYFQTSDGKRMWGWFGAAGLLVRHTDPKTGEKRYLLQKRAGWVDHGNTYSIPGGAMDHISGVPETPEQAAHRESREELGRELPAGTKLAEVRTKTFGEGKGAWSYHTVVMDTPHMFDPEGRGMEGVHDTRNESGGYVWATPHEMADLPLHPHFRATAEELGMPAGNGTSLSRVLEAANAVNG